MESFVRVISLAPCRYLKEALHSVEAGERGVTFSCATPSCGASPTSASAGIEVKMRVLHPPLIGLLLYGRRVLFTRKFFGRKSVMQTGLLSRHG